MIWILLFVQALVNAQDLPSLEEITSPTKSSSSSTTSTSTTLASTTTSFLSQNLENLLPEDFHFNLTQYQPGQFCRCDLLEGACDINCCCDPDCTNDTILAFSHCQDVQVQSYDPKFCFSTQIMIENNTKNSMEKISDKNLFCIISDNMEGKGFNYLDRAPMMNVSDFENMKSRHQAFIWPLTAFDKDQKRDKNGQNSTSYKSGDPILTVTELMEWSHLSLPLAIQGKQCHAFSPIKYLKDEDRYCQLYLEPDTDCTTIPELNAANYLSGFKVVANKATLENLTIEELSEDNILIVPKPEVCINFNRSIAINDFSLQTCR